MSADAVSANSKTLHLEIRKNTKKKKRLIESITGNNFVCSAIT